MDAAMPGSMATCSLAHPANSGLQGRHPSCSGSSSAPASASTASGQHARPSSESAAKRTRRLNEARSPTPPAFADRP
eukprot:7096209-Alexandrium_andersonii.AAC.1